MIGAAWVTRHYRKYKLVVVNAWVDVPDDEDDEVDGDDVREFSRTSNLNPKLFRCDGSEDRDKGSLLDGQLKKEHLKANLRDEERKRNGYKRYRSPVPWQ